MSKEPIVVTRDNFWKLNLSEIQSTYIPEGKKITDLPVYPPRECSWCKHYKEPTRDLPIITGACFHRDVGKLGSIWRKPNESCDLWSQKQL